MTSALTAESAALAPVTGALGFLGLEKEAVIPATEEKRKKKTTRELSASATWLHPSPCPSALSRSEDFGELA